MTKQADYWKGAYERMAARNIELSASVEDFERRLSLRDTYLSEKGLWHEFATTMLPRPALLEIRQTKETASAE